MPQETNMPSSSESLAANQEALPRCQPQGPTVVRVEGHARSHKASGIYLIKNTINGKLYVGSSVDIYRRWRTHISSLNGNRHGNRRLQSSWNKHGGSAFLFTVISEVGVDFIIDAEQRFIDSLKSYDRDRGYNICLIAGSPQGIEWTQESRIKTGLSHKKLWATEEHRSKMLKACASPECKAKHTETRTGKPANLTPEGRERLIEARRLHRHSDEAKQKMRDYNARPDVKERKRMEMKLRNSNPETRAAMSEKLKGRKHSPEAIARMREAQSLPEAKARVSALFKGKPRSEEVKRKISQSHMGVRPSLETREKMRAAKLGKKLTQEQRTKIGESLRIAYETGLRPPQPSGPRPHS